jgi:quercetin dioxygenase-like cupin family protein
MKKINYLLPLLYFIISLPTIKIQAQGLTNNQLGEVYPENIKWTSFPAFPPSASIALLVGDPNKAEPYLARVSVPSGTILMPHTHPENRIYTVISGIFYIGIGDRFDASKLKAYPPGSVFVLPGNTPHFHWARSGAYVTQVTANGPLGLSYINPADDPRNKKK